MAPEQLQVISTPPGLTTPSANSFRRRYLEEARGREPLSSRHTGTDRHRQIAGVTTACSLHARLSTTHQPANRPCGLQLSNPPVWCQLRWVQHHHIPALAVLQCGTQKGAHIVTHKRTPGDSSNSSSNNNRAAAAAATRLSLEGRHTQRSAAALRAPASPCRPAITHSTLHSWVSGSVHRATLFREPNAVCPRREETRPATLQPSHHHLSVSPLSSALS